MKYIRQVLILVSGLVLLVNTASAAEVDSEQVASLNAQISENFASKNWDAVDQGYQQLYELYVNNYELSDPALLPVLRTVGKWKIQANRSNLLSKDSFEAASEAQEFYISIIKEIEAKYGNTSSRLVEQLYGQVMAEYQVLQMLITKPADSFFARVDDKITREECRIIGGHERCQILDFPNPEYYRAQEREKTSQIRKQSKTIEALLARVVEINDLSQSSSELEKAEAEVHLGDYYLYSENMTAAHDSYKRAYQFLTASTDGVGAREILFEQPTRIPALSLSFPGIRGSTHRNNITLAFDIMATGTAENVEVISERDSGNKSFRENAINMVSKSMFRPQLSEGEVLESNPVEMTL